MVFRLVMGIFVFFLPLFGELEHVVRKNETLGGIANRYGVSTSSLQALNGISNPNLLLLVKS